MRKDIHSGIYCIENLTTNKKYIGQSTKMEDRWSKHKSALNRGCHDNDYLQKAWNKYGESDFIFYDLEYCDIDMLDDRERYYIDMHNTLNRNFGYNLKSGGQDTNYFSDETRNKISEANKKYYSEHPEQKQIRSARAYNQWANPEIKAKISGVNNSMYGRHRTDEVKQRISQARTGAPSPKRNTTPVFCIELNKQFKDATEAGKELLLDSSAILKVCRGERKTCGGYHWKFINNGEII